MILIFYISLCFCHIGQSQQGTKCHGMGSLVLTYHFCRIVNMPLFLLQVSYDGELHKHPQLEADLAAVREIYGLSAVSLRYIYRGSVVCRLGRQHGTA